MPDSSKRRGKRLGAIASAAVVLLYAVPLAVGAVAAALGLFRQGDGAVGLLFLLIYGVIGGAVAVGILAVLRQRLREIQGGEEDDASQY
ncbi:hypothetical protein [uncultured Oscillibacter sp.]|uniref:hypothetical protein n=1 Tax=uncultured Oscillibacter sp. TaxID=876091 RepID=UPI0025DC9BBD|nr:hypothetical protein [uncultured Oscillibacter sp.]